jgi:hypothetical protein
MSQFVLLSCLVLSLYLLMYVSSILPSVKCEHSISRKLSFDASRTCVYLFIKESNSIFFTFMVPCIVNVFKYIQQDATLYNDIYYYKCSTCFRRFLRPSSGAQKLYTQHRVFVEL